ncbi:carbohydrate kinase [Breoghania sp.]|uniref:carbohydrate kinase family protein n=1 Tax=Breoghania sp. TaxID=2065378 RepID=UPI002AABEE63|nr:carbohydrate kinase [Breoghania sp.]
MFLVCGEALWDLFAREEGCGLTFDARIGGSPFNVAVGLARLDVPAALLTGLSTDPLGIRLHDVLAREGVETGFLMRTARPTTLSLVDLSPDGSPAYTFYGERAADRVLEPSALPDLETGPGADVWGIHFGSYSLVVEPVASTLKALAEREAGRRLITLDPNVRLNVEPDPAVWRSRIEAFVRHADVVKVSEEDLDLLYPGESYIAIAAQWRDLGAGIVIVTRGKAGVHGFGCGMMVDVDIRAVSVIDTVGAGDSFQAALIAALKDRGIESRSSLRGLDHDQLGEIVAFAVEASAITCTRRGADLPRRSDLVGIGA